jgi:hypothetical protein
MDDNQNRNGLRYPKTKRLRHSNFCFFQNQNPLRSLLQSRPKPVSPAKTCLKTSNHKIVEFSTPTALKPFIFFKYIIYCNLLLYAAKTPPPLRYPSRRKLESKHKSCNQKWQASYPASSRAIVASRG